MDAFLRLARGLSLQTVAEGVETTEQRDQLMIAGCDAAQGFLFARPMPPEDVPGWVATTLPHQPAWPQGTEEG